MRRRAGPDGAGVAGVGAGEAIGTAGVGSGATDGGGEPAQPSHRSPAHAPSSPTVRTTAAPAPSARPRSHDRPFAPASSSVAAARAEAGAVAAVTDRASAEALSGTTSVGSAGGVAPPPGTASEATVSAWAKAPADGQRSAGSFARQRRNTGVSGAAISAGDGSGTGSVTCFISTATGVVPVYGTRPVRHSKAITPSA